jgi:hypothetical protein
LAVYHCNEKCIAFGIRKNMKIFWWFLFSFVFVASLLSMPWDNTKTKATMDTRHETKTVNIGHNTTQKTKKISNTDPTQKK